MSEATTFIPPHVLNTAVLFLVFNRLDTTKQVFEAIRHAKPPRLYVAADGARANKEGEVDKTQVVRDYIMQNIDWKCEVKTLFREENLGCKYAVSGAITWFFDNEEQGIILEDDCLPSQSFFWYCEELLEMYKDDLRVWHISGDNFQNGIARGEGAYYFSQFNHVWGWASWGNRWEKYDVEMKSYKDFLENKIIKKLFLTKKEQRYWTNIFMNVSKGKIDTWDYQWTYTIWCNSGLSILPNKNLISNIGFGPDAVHTKDLESKQSKIARSDLNLPLVNPKFHIRDLSADKFTSAKMFSIENFIFRVYIRIKRVFIK